MLDALILQLNLSGHWEVLHKTTTTSMTPLESVFSVKSFQGIGHTSRDAKNRAASAGLLSLSDSLLPGMSSLHSELICIYNLMFVESYIFRPVRLFVLQINQELKSTSLVAILSFFISSCTDPFIYLHRDRREMPGWKYIK